MFVCLYIYLFILWVHSLSISGSAWDSSLCYSEPEWHHRDVRAWVLIFSLLSISFHFVLFLFPGFSFLLISGYLHFLFFSWIFISSYFFLFTFNFFLFLFYFLLILFSSFLCVYFFLFLFFLFTHVPSFSPLHLSHTFNLYFYLFHLLPGPGPARPSWSRIPLHLPCIFLSLGLLPSIFFTHFFLIYEAHVLRASGKLIKFIRNLLFSFYNINKLWTAWLGA